MIGNNEDAHIADGITEDLITALAKIGQIDVVSRNSAFIYQDKKVSLGEAGRALGASHVVTGSIRTAGNRIRISTQLAETESETQLWAERYDRDMDDIFAIQDEITLTIATALQVELTEGEQARLRYTTTENVSAWKAFIKGLSLFRTVSAETYRQARQCFSEALTHDPDSAQIHAMLGCTHAIEARFFWTADRNHSLEAAKKHADLALKTDPKNADAYAALGYWHMCESRLDESVASYAQAVEIAPDHADLRALYALALTFTERAEDAITEIQAAMRLNPLDPGWYCGVMGHAYRYAGRFDEALAVLEEYHRQSPGFGLVDIVLTCADMGREQQAHDYAQKLIAARPGFTVEDWARTQNSANKDRLTQDCQALEAAGLP